MPHPFRIRVSKSSNGIRAVIEPAICRRVPEDIYRGGVAMTALDASDPHCATVDTVDGREAFDVVVCADGYRSAGRQVVAPGCELTYRGLILWRGVLAETRVDTDHLAGWTVRVMFPGGSGLAYLIPGAGGETAPGARLVTWGFYLQVPADDLAALLVDTDGVGRQGSVPLGKVRPAVTEQLRRRLVEGVPPAYLDLIDRTVESSIQAIYSTVVSTYHRGRVCLIGDAGSLLPPFTGSGVFKGMTNAIFLGEALEATTPLDEALPAWSAAQCAAAERFVPIAIQTEREKVFGVPDLSDMDSADSQRLDADSVPRPPARAPSPVAESTRPRPSPSTRSRQEAANWSRRP